MHLTERGITDKGLCSKDHGTKKFSRSSGEGAFPTAETTAARRGERQLMATLLGRFSSPTSERVSSELREAWNQRSTHICLDLSDRFSLLSSPGALTGFPASQPSPALQCHACQFPVSWLYCIPLHLLGSVRLLYTSSGGLSTYPYFMVFPTNTRGLSKIEIKQMTFGCFVFFGEKDKY